MIRFLILAGYAGLMMFLQVTGKLDQFINVHYQYLAVLSTVIALLLALFQLFTWVKEDPGKAEEHKEHLHEQEEHDHADHDHGLKRPYQRVIAYLLLALPIVVGTLFPTVSLSTTIVEAKGFQFPLSKESVGDPQMETQYLQPNTSLYYNKEDYQKQMTELMNKYGDQNSLTITDENYLEVMELIYNYPSEFIGRKVHYEGFVFQTEAQDTFVFRFGIIHCVADSGVFGLRVNLPPDAKVANDQWLAVDGVIASEFYAPFKRNLPMVNATSITPIAPPENQYVYRTF
ncbi:TIGR03943 family putative permease subunit [Enterococcus asini]|uniref:TIGR03943 family putative permease subunit n=1 Tax=Enterococcus asini TaxID=57732 RepID=UPI0022E420B5|nr:TIGR03943 family protein [Enterococcus asini]